MNAASVRPSLARRLQFRRMGSTADYLVNWEPDTVPWTPYWPHRAEAPQYPWMTVTRQLSDGTTYTFDVSCSVEWRYEGGELYPRVASATVRTPRGTYRNMRGLSMREKRDYLRHVGALDKDDRNEDDEDEE